MVHYQSKSLILIELCPIFANNLFSSIFTLKIIFIQILEVIFVCHDDKVLKKCM